MSRKGDIPIMERKATLIAIIRLTLAALLNSAPFLYCLACWFQLGASGSPAAWNILGRLLLEITH